MLANPDRSGHSAFNFMMLFGNSVAYWLMVKLAMAAQREIDGGSTDRFYHQKIATSQFAIEPYETRIPDTTQKPRLPGGYCACHPLYG